MASVLPLLVWMLCSVRVHGFAETSVPATTTSFSYGIPATTHSNAAFARRSSYATTASATKLMAMPVWPYVGCSGSCGGGPPGLFAALALCGAGFPLSEDVLLIGLAPRFFGVGAPAPISLRARLLYYAAAVGGVATADTLTVGLGRAIRANAGALAEQAPGFVGRLLAAVREQLAVEARRDHGRLKEQIEARLRTATIDLGAQLRTLAGMRDSRPDAPKVVVESRARATWRRLAASNAWVRRITCNTRTSLAAWGQTSTALTKIVFTRGRSQSLSQGRNRSKRSNSRATGTVSSPPPPSDSLFAGIDNRLALGQRWPLALLSGFSAAPELAYGPYFAGAALAAGTATLPVQLALGAALRDWSRKVCYVLIATAQLCRYGPIWAAVVAAIADTVKAEIDTARRRTSGVDRKDVLLQLPFGLSIAKYRGRKDS